MLLALCGLLAAGCEGTDGMGGFGRPLIWPQAARLGDSVALLVASNAVLNDPEEPYDASPENLVIRLGDGVSVVDVAPVSVVETPVAATAVASAASRGTFATWAVFDLPATWPGGTPAQLSVTAVRGGVASASYGNTLEILGTGGSPTQFSSYYPPTDYSPRPMLRLRPKWNPATGRGFDPAWTIGAVELTLRWPVHPPGYTQGGLSNPKPSAAGDAAGALAIAGAESVAGDTKSVVVRLVAPTGFGLAHGTCNTPPCYVGRGPLLDVVFDKSSVSIPQGTPVFEASSFTVEEVRVWSPDGARLDGPGSAPTDFFKLFAVRNLSTGA